MPLTAVQQTTPWRFLLVLRLVAGVPLVYFGVLHLVLPADVRAILAAGRLPHSDFSVAVVPLVEILAGLLLLAGLLSRVGGMLALGAMSPALLLTFQLMERNDVPPMPLFVPVMVAVASAVLVLLGGGAASVDERMCPRPVDTSSPMGARKRIVILGGGF